LLAGAAAVVVGVASGHNRANGVAPASIKPLITSLYPPSPLTQTIKGRPADAISRAYACQARRSWSAAG
jgi:hypothetical protein